MSYDYQTQRAHVFTEAGQRGFIAIRDACGRMLDVAGAVQMGKLIAVPDGPANNWTAIACVDRMVELGELREIKYGECAGQDRIFVRGE